MSDDTPNSEEQQKAWRKRMQASPFANPRGPLGWVAGHLMARLSTQRSEWGLSLLDLHPEDQLLEVGFGPGMDIQRAARAVTGGTVAGGGGGAPLFTNYGTLRKSAGTRNSVVPKEMVLANIGGTIAVDTGTLSLGPGLTSRFGSGDGGKFEVAAGATLQLNDGTSDAVYNGQYTASGAGTILLAGGSINSEKTSPMGRPGSASRMARAARSGNGGTRSGSSLSSLR